jgi:hypothetical protein
MTDTRQQGAALIERILQGGGTASRSQRRTAFENEPLAKSLRSTVETILTPALAISCRDIATARDSGFTARFRNVPHIAAAPRNDSRWMP